MSDKPKRDEKLEALDPFAGPPWSPDEDPEFWSQERIDQETIDAMEHGMASGWAGVPED